MVGPLPLPFRSLVPLIRCLPMGRYRAAYALCRVLPPRFVTRLPRKLGGLAFVCDTADVVSRTAFAGSWEPTQTLLVSNDPAAGHDLRGHRRAVGILHAHRAPRGSVRTAPS